MEIQFFNSIFFWKAAKYFKDFLKIFIIELKEKVYYYYLKLIILYPGLCSIFLIIGINLVMMHSHVTYLSIMDINQTSMSEALSVGIFEPNPEYIYLYRIHRKIELINSLIQKIKHKNPTHLNLDYAKNTVFFFNYIVYSVSEHQAKVFEILYAEKFP